MKIVAMLAWWDEPPAELEACVASLPALCDAVVAVDGAYEMTPGATAASPPDQAEAIWEAAVRHGIEARVIVPDKIWTGQVEKRDAMLRLAAEDADWVIAVDADHRLVGNRLDVRREIERVGTSADSIRHDFYTPMPDDPADLKRLSPHPWHTRTAGQTIEHALIIRRLDDMRVERDHWGYSGVRAGTRVALGNWRARHLPPGRYHRLRTQFRVDHVCFQRDRMRLERNRRYCQVRDGFKSRNGYEP